MPMLNRRNLFDEDEDEYEFMPDLIGEPEYRESEEVNLPPNTKVEETTFDFDDPRTDQYLEHLKREPKKDEHKSSFGRKLGGGLVAALLGTDFGIVHAPIRNARRKWKEEGRGLEEGATFEQKGNIQRRLGLSTAMANTRADKRLKSEVDRAYQAHDDRMAAIARLKDKDKRAAETAKEKIRVGKEIFAANERGRAHSRSIAERSLADRQKRTGMLETKLNRGEVEDPIDPNKQKAIDEQAKTELARDPRFSKWYNPTRGKFTEHIYKPEDIDDDGEPKADAEPTESMDEATREMLRVALAKNRDRVANRKRSDYGPPPGFNSDYGLEDLTEDGERSYDEESIMNFLLGMDENE